MEGKKSKSHTRSGDEEVKTPEKKGVAIGSAVLETLKQKRAEDAQRKVQGNW